MEAGHTATPELPKPYEEVFIWWDSNSGVQRRVARLDAAKTHFQLSTYNCAAKGQYLAPVNQVLRWAPIVEESEQADLKRKADAVDGLVKALENNDLHCREALKLAESELKKFYGDSRTTQQAEVMCTLAQALAILEASAKERAALAAAGA